MKRRSCPLRRSVHFRSINSAFRFHPREREREREKTLGKMRRKFSDHLARETLMRILDSLALFLQKSHKFVPRSSSLCSGTSTACSLSVFSLLSVLILTRDIANQTGGTPRLLSTRFRLRTPSRLRSCLCSLAFPRRTCRGR